MKIIKKFLVMLLIMANILPVNMELAKAAEVSDIYLTVYSLEHKTASLRVSCSNNNYYNQSITIYAKNSSGTTIGTKITQVKSAYDTVDMTFDRTMKANEEVSFYIKLNNGNVSATKKSTVSKCSTYSYSPIDCGPKGASGTISCLKGIGGTATFTISGATYNIPVDENGSYAYSFNKTYMTGLDGKVNVTCKAGCNLCSDARETISAYSPSIYSSDINCFNNVSTISSSYRAEEYIYYVKIGNTIYNSKDNGIDGSNDIIKYGKKHTEKKATVWCETRWKGEKSVEIECDLKEPRIYTFSDYDLNVENNKVSAKYSVEVYSNYELRNIPSYLCASVDGVTYKSKLVDGKAIVTYPNQTKKVTVMVWLESVLGDRTESKKCVLNPNADDVYLKSFSAPTVYYTVDKFEEYKSVSCVIQNKHFNLNPSNANKYNFEYIKSSNTDIADVSFDHDRFYVYKYGTVYITVKDTYTQKTAVVRVVIKNNHKGNVSIDKQDTAYHNKNVLYFRTKYNIGQIQIYRKTGAYGTWKCIKDTRSDIDSYTDKNVNPNKKYYYKAKIKVKGSNIWGDMSSAKVYWTAPKKPKTKKKKGYIKWKKVPGNVRYVIEYFDSEDVGYNIWGQSLTDVEWIYRSTKKTKVKQYSKLGRATLEAVYAKHDGKIYSHGNRVVKKFKSLWEDGFDRWVD